MRLLLALKQTGQYPKIATEGWARRLQQQGGDLRGVTLAVSVDAAIALLNADEAPGDVEVDEFVALLVQVDALAGDVTGDQHADGGVRLFEGLDDLLLFGVAEATVQHRDLVGGEGQVVDETITQPVQGGDSLSEDNGSLRLTSIDADMS
ncbi:hypothetical protein PA08_0761 [Cutibacterium modestum P08]|nr:hypothetical protein PA08_0761 [Cutibacterium modestum P08]